MSAGQTATSYGRKENRQWTISDLVWTLCSQAASAADCRHSSCDVRSCWCALPDSVSTNVGIFRGREAELRTAGGATAPLSRCRGLWYLQVWVNNIRELPLVDSGLGSALEPGEQTVSIVDQDGGLGELAPSWRMCVIWDHIQ